MNTIKQVVDYLVSIGMPLAHAKVAADQAYNYAADDDVRGLCMSDEDTPIDVSTTGAKNVYSDFCGENGYYKVTAEGFEFDGDGCATYDLNGNRIAW